MGYLRVRFSEVELRAGYLNTGGMNENDNEEE
jgi:hypothetical protein